MSIKRLTLAVLCIAGLAVTASAQRDGGGAHGRAGGHSGAARGGSSSSASHGSSSSPRLPGSRPSINGSRAVDPSRSYRANYAGSQGRQGRQGSYGYRRPYNGYGGSGPSLNGSYLNGSYLNGSYLNGSYLNGPYLNGPWSGWGGTMFRGYLGSLATDDLGTNDRAAFYDDDSAHGYSQAPYGDGAQGPYAAPDPGQPTPYPQYAASPQEAPQAPAPPPHEPQPNEAVTLVFKDGRPTQQIHNYMMTSTMLYVRDQHHSEIPLAELDLAATRQANRAAGVDFGLVPKSP